jgi:hypothetical protein
MIRAPCFRRDTPLWFWEVWTTGPFVLTDTAELFVWPEKWLSPNTKFVGEGPLPLDEKWKQGPKASRNNIAG